ncbi:vacuolar ATP synthase subunit [Babesia ovata]|uniref:Vacuolar ATP synthase subunit n=1 Tax=Babesia ovata TaxID=189622 RepID=A0A2H6K965_9APIC|nr:vacuolar ATP synthase subunit [Babesia ovata]GBE59535.1 vacuolar ATP synthase subunit [Babesia ovata]
MSSTKGSNALIQQLLKAEEEAEAIVKRAKENRVKLLNEAVSAAENDLKQFSETEEKRLLEQYQKEAASDDPHLDDLENKANELIKENDEALRECKSKLVNELAAAVVDIDVSVPDSFRYFVNRSSN